MGGRKSSCRWERFGTSACCVLEIREFNEAVFFGIFFMFSNGCQKMILADADDILKCS